MLGKRPARGDQLTKHLFRLFPSRSSRSPSVFRSITLLPTKPHLMDSKDSSSASPAPFQGLSTDAKPPLAHYGNQDPLGLEAGHGGTGADGASLPPHQIVILEKSIGVQRIEATKSVFTWRNLLFVYAFFALLSWSLSLGECPQSSFIGLC